MEEGEGEWKGRGREEAHVDENEGETGLHIFADRTTGIRPLHSSGCDSHQ